MNLKLVWVLGMNIRKHGSTREDQRGRLQGFPLPKNQKIISQLAMNRKISYTILLLLFAFQANAFTILPEDAFNIQTPTKASIFSLIWKCKWRVSCYKETKLGALTDLASTNQLSAFPTLYNSNLDYTVETGTTSVASITTLSNLISIGTITTGGWNGTAIPVAYGGTGTTSPALFQVLVGSSTNGIGVVLGTGSSGQFLTSNGVSAAPTWTTSVVDQAANYTWSGTHTFNTGTTSVN